MSINIILERLTRLSLDRPKTVIATLLLLSVAFASQLPSITIDTDPENMLEPDQPDRVFYDGVKKDFGVHDLIVLGIVDDRGVFQPESLAAISKAIAEITEIPGVVISDVVSLTTTNNVKSQGGLLDIHTVMRKVPRTDEAIQSLRREIAENPFLHEKVASDDGTAVAIYVPIEEKRMSYRIANRIEAILHRSLLPGQRYHLAGLPVAEDTFGHEMFLQMAVVAPMAFMVILLLVLLLFRRVMFLLPIGVDAMLAVVWAMGLLIGTGHTVHIMSSMIPVFLMPAAILDDVHILSEFSDRYRSLGDKRRALLEGMQGLYRPMLLTSLTSAAGFASLSLANIPPVRVFGLFVAFGIMAAWLFSMTIVPAVISMMSDARLRRSLERKGAPGGLLLDRLLRPVRRIAFLRARAVLLVCLICLTVGVLGIARIQVNDNPVNWFKWNHPMRVGDRVMNRLFGGTYMAYVVAEGDKPGAIKEPEVVSYLDRLQIHLEEDPIVGKTSSVADIVKRINLVLHDNDPAYDRVPGSREAVSQFLFLFQSSGDPDDLDNFVDRDARKANIWVQMKNGDNQEMHRIENRLAAFTHGHPPPSGLALRWSGLTYINKTWQDLMVSGMLKAILGSFAVVFLLMVVEFRSLAIGMLSMVPLCFAILFSYGLVGWAGKDYDMPIAICSSLSLGLGIDFAIHFLARARQQYGQTLDLAKTIGFMFGDPGRAIVRNAIVISIGFLPLIASTLTPYVTVGLFFGLLMVFSTVATLVVLPATLRVIGPRILQERRQP